MPEIRIDPLCGDRVIVAGERSQRPGGTFACLPPEPINHDCDPFAEGNEARTPGELYATRRSGSEPNSAGWTVRVVPNLYPALDEQQAPSDELRGGGNLGGGTAIEGPRALLASSRPGPPSQSQLFASIAATGAHEVIVNGPQEVPSLADLPCEQVKAAMEAWRQRMKAHAEAPYVQLIVNERAEAGASLPHTHAQLYALPFVPAAAARERERFNAYANQTMGQNLLADLLQEEVRLRERIIAIDDEAVLLAPYASKLPFQLMLVPRARRPRFEQDGPLGACLLHEGLRRLATHLGSSPPLNLWVRTAPSGAEHFCWRIDVMPRLTHLAGLELSTGLALNILPPERAASLLREVKL
jgi:UDPglucose--hexose-1-phosphate uridylyltransferase